MDFGMPYLLEMHDLEECCALAKELGLQFVELNANFPDCSVEKLDPAQLWQQRYYTALSAIRRDVRSSQKRRIRRAIFR